MLYYFDEIGIIMIMIMGIFFGSLISYIFIQRPLEKEKDELTKESIKLKAENNELRAWKSGFESGQKIVREE